MKIPLEPALTLLHELRHGTLATNSAQLPGYPYATVVPYVLDEAHCPIIFVSALAEHTRNLRADPRVSLSVIQPGTAEVQDAPRLTLVGDADPFAPPPALVARYLHHEPSAEQLMALDFSFFRLVPRRLRYIGGVGRMGWLEAGEWAALPRLTAAEEAQVLREAGVKLDPRIRLLGADCFGLDYEVGGRRKRQCFPNAPLPAATLVKVAIRMAPGLA